MLEPLRFQCAVPTSKTNNSGSKKRGEGNLKILLITSHLNTGGITQYVLSLSVGLIRKGHQVTVASSGGDWEEKFRREGISLLQIPLKTKSVISLQTLRSALFLKRFLKENPVDIIHGNNRVSQFTAFLCWKLTGIPYVSTFHGFYKKHLGRKLVKCDGIRSIAITQAVADHIQEDFKISSRNTRVVYNGTDMDQLPVSLSKEDVRKKYKINGTPVMGIIARLTHEKNHKLAIGAFARLMSDFPQAILVLAGRGRLESQLRAMVKRKGLTNNVIFLHTEKIGEILSVLDVCIHPATSEGFGIAIIEAQAIGIPVVASYLGGMKEIIEDGSSGLLLKDASDETELYEKLRTLLSDEPLRQKIIKNAKQRASELFSVDKMTEGTLEVYKEVLSPTNS